MSMAEFFHMGGYAFYVWGAYGFAMAVLICNLLLPQLRQRKMKRQQRGCIREEGIR